MKKVFLFVMGLLAMTMSMYAAGGALSGKFTINADGKQVMFSQGNLQATTTDLGANWTWGFAEHQYDYIGNAVANNKINGNGIVSENGTVDLFGWSTAANFYGINNSTDDDDYVGDFVDWGNNTIAIEGNVVNRWRTLTIDEWYYIVGARSNWYNLRGQATVNGVHGYVLLPDGADPADFGLTADPNNWTTNVYDAETWQTMELNGAVFLPAAGSRQNIGVQYAGVSGGYMSSSPTSNENTANLMQISETMYATKATGPRNTGRSVRLVTPVPQVGDTLRYAYKGNSLYYKITQKNEYGNIVTIVSDGTTPDYPFTWAEANKPEGALVIPNTIIDAEGTEYKVAYIEQDALRTGADKLTSIDFSDNTFITSVSNRAFMGCNNVTSITLSDYITDISGYCFQGCKLTSLDLKNVTYIGMANFAGCNIDSVHLPKSVVTISDQTYLFNKATKITIDEANNNFAVVGNVLYNKALTKIYSLPLGLTSGELHIVPTAKRALFGAMNGCQATIYFYSQVQPENGPDYRNSPAGDVIVRCQDYDFYTSGSFIGGDSFTKNDFYYVDTLIAKLLDKIEVEAANGTVKLDTTECNNVKVTIIPNDGFTFVNWFDGITDNPRIFEVTSDTVVTANVKKNLGVGDTFRSNTVEGVPVLYKVLTNDAGDKTVQVGDYSTFSPANAISQYTSGVVTIPDSAVYFDEKFEVVLVADYAFKNCYYVSTLNLPNTIKEIKPLGVSELTGLTAVNVPNTLVRTGRYNFAYMNSLKSLTLPSTIKYIDFGTFFMCGQLETINGWDPAKIERMGASTITSSGTSKIWNNTDYVQGEDGFKYMGDILILMPNSETITIEEGARIIARSATSIPACKHIDIPSTAEAISSGVVYNCTLLETCTIHAVTPPLIYNAYDVSREEDATWLRSYYASTSLDFGSNPTPADVKYYVPKEALPAYKASDKWNMLDLRPIGGWTVSFKDHEGNDIVAPQQVEQGEAAVIPTEVAAYYTYEHMYVFANDWTIDANGGDTIYTAKYTEQDLPEYKVNWHDANGDVFSFTKIEHGHSAVAKGEEKAATLVPPACMQFDAWDKDLSNIVADMDVYPTWKDAKYTVTFVDGLTSEVIQTKPNRECHEDVDAPSAPEHAGYVFSGWDSDAYKDVTSDLTITAEYSPATGIDNTMVGGKAVKVIRDGQLFILRDGKTYNAQGVELH